MSLCCSLEFPLLPEESAANVWFCALFRVGVTEAQREDMSHPQCPSWYTEESGLTTREFCLPYCVCFPHAFSRTTTSQHRHWRASRVCLARILLHRDGPPRLLGKSQQDINFTTVNSLHNIFVLKNDDSE